MKKLYAVSTLLLTIFGFLNSGFAQYTATHTGNWSSPVTWAPGAKPSATCNNCTITINANVTVTLDADVSFSGTTVMTIGTDASSPAKLVIPSSGGTSFATGNNIILIYNGVSAQPTISLKNANTSVNATSAGTYDGVFSSNLGYIKLLGNPPGAFFADGSIQFPSNATFGTSLSGPINLNANATLPVILVGFNADLDKNKVELSWTSEEEINSDHFSIDRSEDGIHWGSIGSVPAKGNSDVANNYSFTDNTPLTGINYYRLQMVDRDGKYAYSDVKVVRLFLSGFSVFPNPARDFLNITLGSDASAELTFRLINQNGQVMKNQKISNAAGTTITYSISSYASGNYLLEVIDNKGNIQTSKVIISRP
jgi:Secretion system C-terminal sorting domain